MQQAFIASSTSFNGSMKIPLPTLTYITNIVMYVVDFRILVNLVFYEELPYKQKLKWHAVWIIKKKRGLKKPTALFSFFSLFKASTHLVWSVFGLTNLETMKSHGELSSAVVGVLYVLFLILSVIMLINMLVALLTNTYQKVEVM